jgi:predicted nucleic acid-binding Zn ribbon protein
MDHELMATYLYETIPAEEGGKSETFEIQQSMKDAPLTKHPQSGVPVRRVITGGFGFVSKGGTAPVAPRPPAGGGCGSGCGCH